MWQDLIGNGASAPSQVELRAFIEEPWAPARGPVPPLARRALTGAAGSAGAGGDNPKIKV